MLKRKTFYLFNLIKKHFFSFKGCSLNIHKYHFLCITNSSNFNIYVPPPKKKNYSPVLVVFASWRDIPHIHLWILCSACSTMFFGVVSFVLKPVECGLLLKGVIFLEWWAARPAPAPDTVIQQGCRVLGLVAIWSKTFFPPVSFSLDQLTDLAKSDVAGSLDPTWGKWWEHSTTGEQSEWLFLAAAWLTEM